MSFARTSIAPVFRFSFTAPERFSTTPVTATTNSARSFVAFSNPSAPVSLSSKINCMIPERSRKSTKMMPPLFLLFCTQPITVTVCPTFSFVSSAHRHVRRRPFIDSAIFLHSFLMYNSNLQKIPGSLRIRLLPIIPSGISYFSSLH